MVTQKGFTLIEFMIITVIVSILASILFGTVDELQEKEAASDSIDAVIENAPVEYIDNGVRTNEQVRLKEHSDGKLWACNTITEDCYEVVKW